MNVKLLMFLLGAMTLTLAAPQACARTPDRPAPTSATIPGPYVHVNVRILDVDARQAPRIFRQISAFGVREDGESLPLVIVKDKSDNRPVADVLNVYARYAQGTVAVSITILVGLQYLDTATVEVTDERGRAMPHQGFDYYEQTNSGPTDPVAIRLTVPV